MQSKQCKTCKEIKSLTLFHKSKYVRDGATARCKTCINARSVELNGTPEGKTRRAVNSKKYLNTPKGRIVNRRSANKYAKTANGKRIIAANRKKWSQQEKVISKRKKHRSTSVKYKEGNNRRNRKHSKTLKGKARTSFHTARRRIIQLQRTPKYLTIIQILEIQAFYTEAIRLTQETSIPHEVDHIYPLQGKEVSGLHVPWNLQILTKEQNRSKGNKMPNLLK